MVFFQKDKEVEVLIYFPRMKKDIYYLGFRRAFQLFEFWNT